MDEEFHIIRNFATVPEIVTPYLAGCRRTYSYSSPDLVGYRVTEHFYIPGIENDYRAKDSLPDCLLGAYAAICGLYKHKYIFSQVMINDYGPKSRVEFHNDNVCSVFCILCIGGAGDLGIRRVHDFGRPSKEIWVTVRHGDLIYMPPSFDSKYQHSVRNNEYRQSVVFRAKN